MKQKKRTASTSKQVPKKSTKKTTGTSKATKTKQNNRKRVAPNDSDADSDDEVPKRNKRNKKCHVEEVEEDESETSDVEEVTENDEDVPLVEEKCKAAAGGSVSENTGVSELRTHCEAG
jgi:hypothetical protein